MAERFSIYAKGGCKPTEPSLRLKSGGIEEQVKVVASPRNQLEPAANDCTSLLLCSNAVGLLFQ